MKFQKTFFVLLLSMLCLAQVYAQNSAGVATGSNIDALDVNRFSLSKFTSAANKISYNDIEGTPYIDNNSGANNNLPIGKFYTSEFEYIETAFARYNAHTDMMEVSLLDDGVDYYLLRKEPNFLYVMLKDKTYRAYTYDDTMGYFVIISNNDKQMCTLLKKERVVYRKAEKASSSFVTSTPASFQKLRDIYYLKIAATLFEIPKKKKHFYQLFGNKAEAIQKYVKDNRLQLQREQDLLKITAYFNTLTL